MKKPRYTEEQIAFSLKQTETGPRVEAQFVQQVNLQQETRSHFFPGAQAAFQPFCRAQRFDHRIGKDLGKSMIKLQMEDFHLVEIKFTAIHF